ncbi:hypothetical protein ACFL96_08350 [Thermoproteota archaeon]
MVQENLAEEVNSNMPYDQFMESAYAHEQRGDQLRKSQGNPVDDYQKAFMLYKRAFNLDPRRNQEAIMYGISVLNRLRDYHAVQGNDEVFQIDSIKEMVGNAVKEIFGVRLLKEVENV